MTKTPKLVPGALYSHPAYSGVIGQGQRARANGDHPGSCPWTDSLGLAEWRHGYDLEDAARHNPTVIK